MSPKAVERFLRDEECKKILKNYVSDSVILEDASIFRLGDEIVGYLGEYYKLSLTYVDKQNSGTKSVTCFVKRMPENNPNQNNFIKLMGVFRKEQLVYTNLIGPFLKLSSAPFAAKMLLAEPETYLVLEDLSIKGFKTSKSKYFTLDQCKSVIATLARFHGATLIYEEKESSASRKPYRIGDYYKEELTESTFSFQEGHPRQKWCVTTTRCVSSLISLIVNFDNKDKITEKLYGFVFDKLPRLLEPSENFRNVCSHDDLHSNNIMFNDSLDSVLVDFQLTRYTPPAFDVMLFLLINLDNQLFRDHKTTLLEMYYSLLGEELEAHNISLKKIIPKKEFYRSVDHYFAPALLEAVMYGTTVYLEGELSEMIVSNAEVFSEFMFINRSKYIVKEYQDNTIFKERLNEVLMPLVDFLMEE